MRIKTIVVFLLPLLSSLTLQAATVDVLRHPDPKAPLAERWKWAQSEAKNRKGAWTVYTFQRQMDEDETIGLYEDGAKSKPTIREVLTGARSIDATQEKETVQEQAKRVLNELDAPSKKKVWKEIAVLIRMRPASGEFDRVHISNYDLFHHFHGLPILWLGPVESSESADLLRTFYRGSSDEKRKEDLVSAIALHQNSPQVISFLKDVVTKERSIDLRKSGVFWLGQTQDPQALSFLLEIVQTSSMDLRKPAVFSISQMRFTEARNALIALARQKDAGDSRLEAIFWLGQQGSDEAARTLEQITFEEVDEDVQKKAIFSASQLRKDQGLPLLARIATKHPAVDAREEAVFWLGQTGSAAEGNLLEQITQNDPSHSVQKKAVFSISQMRKDDSIPRLERIAKTHPDRDIKKEAIFWLGQMDDTRAKNVLLQLLNKS